VAAVFGAQMDKRFLFLFCKKKSASF